MGGGISACFAILSPKRTQSLMVMDSNTAAGLEPSASVRASRLETINLCARAATEGERQALVEQFIADNASYRIWRDDRLITPPPDHREYRAIAIAATAPLGLGDTVGCMLDSDFPVERIAEIKVPTLVLAGSHDPGMKTVKITHERIGHSKFKLIDNAGHLSNIDQPRDFDAAVLEFLERVEA